MADPTERTEAAPHRVEDRNGEQRTMEGQTMEDVATPSSDQHEEHGTGVLKFFGLELGIFATVVILGIIFLAAIIIFAVTR
jgi:hypothetical protein